jgi:hypothetical protein
MLLMVGDRVDSMESSLRSFASRRPDNPITETGILAEFSHHGFSSRVGQKRTDLKHQMLDPLIVGIPWAVRLGAAYAAVKVVAGRRSRSRR